MRASRRSPYIGLLVLSAFAAICACASSPEENGDAVGEASPAEPEGTSKLPPSMPSSSDDAGSTSSTSKDSGAPRKDASTPAPPDDDAGTPPPSGTGGDCDPNDPVYAAEAVVESFKPSPRTCGLAGGTCAATECCYGLAVCVDL